MAGGTSEEGQESVVRNQDSGVAEVSETLFDIQSVLRDRVARTRPLCVATDYADSRVDRRLSG